MNDNLARVYPIPQESYDHYSKINKERAKERARQKNFSRLSMLVSSALVITLAFTVVSRYMHINEMEKQISTTAETLNTLRASNDQKEVSIESGMSMDDLAYAAQTRLGMNKPAKNQIVYLSVKNVDCSYVACN